VYDQQKCPEHLLAAAAARKGRYARLHPQLNMSTASARLALALLAPQNPWVEQLSMVRGTVVGRITCVFGLGVPLQ
jgi:hypothetical protein